jgi:hypothetical protein
MFRDYDYIEVFLPFIRCSFLRCLIFCLYTFSHCNIALVCLVLRQECLIEEYMGKIAEACAVTALSVAPTPGSSYTSGTGSGSGNASGSGSTTGAGARVANPSGADRARAVVLGSRWQAAVVTTAPLMGSQVNSYLQSGKAGAMATAAAAFMRTRW